MILLRRNLVPLTTFVVVLAVLVLCCSCRPVRAQYGPSAAAGAFSNRCRVVIPSPADHPAEAQDRLNFIRETVHALDYVSGNPGVWMAQVDQDGPWVLVAYARTEDSTGYSTGGCAR